MVRTRHEHFVRRWAYRHPGMVLVVSKKAPEVLQVHGFIAQHLRWVVFAGGTRQVPEPDLCNTTERSAVVDIYDTKLRQWSTDCLSVGRTALAATSFGNTAALLTFDPASSPIDLFTFAD